MRTFHAYTFPLSANGVERFYFVCHSIQFIFSILSIKSEEIQCKIYFILRIHSCVDWWWLLKCLMTNTDVHRYFCTFYMFMVFLPTYWFEVSTQLFFSRKTIVNNNSNIIIMTPTLWPFFIEYLKLFPIFVIRLVISLPFIATNMKLKFNGKVLMWL